MSKAIDTMSVRLYEAGVHESYAGVILDAPVFLNNIVKDEGLRLKSCIFNTQSEFRMNSEFAASALHKEQEISEGQSITGSRKRKRNKKKEEKAGHVDYEIKLVFDALMSTARKASMFTDNITLSEDNNVQSREDTLTLGCADLLLELQDMPHSIAETLDTIHTDKQTGEDQSLFHCLVHSKPDKNTIVSLHQRRFILPQNSSFIMSHIDGLKAYSSAVSHKFQFIVIDPPWENKSVKRKKTYNTLTNYDLFKLPVKDLAAEGSLIALWCTNKPSQHIFVKEKLLPAWGFTAVSTWYWVKVTKSGTPIRPFGVEGKKPYEKMLIAARTGVESPINIPPQGILISVPSLLHSSKPPLIDLVRKWLPEKPRCLELFARNLLPNFTSWGNEVLRHQDMDYYEPIS